MHTFEIFDNLINRSNANQMEDILLSQDFPWFYIKKSSGDAERVDGYSDTVQFEHHFLRDGVQTSQLLLNFCELLNLNDVLKKTGLQNKVLRVKSNLLLKTQKTPNTPHIDFSQPHFVLLYYVNDSDGPTTFYEKSEKSFKKIKQVTPKKGRFVLFDGNTYHSSTPPQKNDCRCVININVLP